MAWSFRRRIKLIPGVHLNFSKSGISTSIGFRGASVTLGKNGTFVNTGIPGTGFYNRQKLSSVGQNQNNNNVPQGIKTIEDADNIISVEADEVTSQNMQGIKDTIIKANKQRQELTHDIKKVKTTLFFTRVKLILSFIFFISLISKKVKEAIVSDISNQKQTISELREQRENSFVNLDIQFDDEIKIKYEKIVSSFKDLLTSQKIWDITSAVSNDRVATRSSASTTEKKKEVRFDFKSLQDIKSKYSVLYFKNANGADLYFYPSFIVMQANNGSFGLVDFKELNFNFRTTRFVEIERVPSDSKIIEYTWAKVNKNGSPDKRFKGNYQIPVVRYGTISLSTQTGMNEEWEFSNYEACEKFAHDFNDYQTTMNSLTRN